MVQRSIKILNTLGSSVRTSILILLVSTIVLLGTKRVADDSTSTTTSCHGPKTQKTEKISYPNKEGKKVTTPQVLCPEDAIYNLSILAIIAFCHRVQIKSSASSCKSDTHTSQYSHKGWEWFLGYWCPRTQGCGYGWLSNLSSKRQYQFHWKSNSATNFIHNWKLWIERKQTYHCWVTGWGWWWR